MSELLKFVSQIPADWATAPIYVKGAALPNDREACGKSPLGRASYEDLSPAATALYIERQPEVFQAVGVYAGPRSQGLVIFDVDANLGAIQMKWGEDLANAPKISSPKENAAKYLFMVPKELWGTVEGLSLAASGEGWEVLWGRQGLLCGAYPKGGEYSFEGDLSAVPEAPGWLLARMQESFKEKHSKADKKALKDGRWSVRSREEKIAVAQSCLSVITPQGRGSEQLWWQIGAMLNSELPGEEGLNLWREWSMQDNEYTDDWANGKDPCGDRWEAGFKQNGGLGFGSLVHLADQHDPNRNRFRENGCAHIIDEVDSTPIRYRQEYMTGPELLKRSIELEESIEDPALLDQAKHLLALEAGRREGAIAIDRLLDQHITFKRSKGGKPADVSQLDDAGFEYLVPGLIPMPWLLLVHADGGTGKSAMAMTLCKHVVQGKPFNVHGKMFEVPKGKALWLNGDQSERITRRQFNLIGVETGVDVVGEWDMSWYHRFCRLQGGGMDAEGNRTPGKYDLIVIDSLDGCNDSNPYEENRREYAYPLKRLARRNGQDFGACTIVVIHHNNKTGGFRGTSAIRAAVDETWNMTRLDTAQLAKLSLPFNTRVITVEKSRDDREGQQMVFTLQSDYTYKIAALEGDTVIRGTGPNSYMLDVLDAMAEDTSVLWCAPDIEAHPSLGGVNRKRAIRYALKRLEEQKLIERCAKPADRAFDHRPPMFYRALSTKTPVPFTKRGLAYGNSKNSVSKDLNPVIATDDVDKAICQNTSFVNMNQLEQAVEEAIDKDPLSTKAPSNYIPSSAVDVDIYNHSDVIEGNLTDEEVRARMSEAHKMWD